MIKIEANKQRGFTLIEMIGVLAIISILGGIIAPKVFDAINDARDRQAEGNIHAIQVAMISFAKDTGVWPGQYEGIYYLYSTGSATTAASTSSMCGGKGRSGNLADYLIKNTNNYRGWRGPYMDAMPEDPWHFRYTVNAGGLFGMGGGNVWILSPGPDGKCNTLRTADTVSGDDVALLIQRNQSASSAISVSGGGGAKAGGTGAGGGKKAINLATMKGAAILGLSPAQIAKLTPVQIAMMSAANYGKLTAAQKAALTTAQLTERKIANNVRGMVQEQFPKLTPSQMKYITTQQLGKINNAWWFGQIPAANKSQLSQSQIQAIPSAVVGPNAGKLTAQQIGWLEPAQLSAVKGGDALVNLLKKVPATITKISPTQIGSITNGWWMGQLVGTVGANLSKAQVNAIPAAIYPNIKGKLTASQQAWRP